VPGADQHEVLGKRGRLLHSRHYALARQLSLSAFNRNPIRIAGAQLRNPSWAIPAPVNFGFRHASVPALRHFAVPSQGCADPACVEGL
jgi:hypothetical protein